MSLAIDARMLAHSGIGTYVSNVLPRLVANHRGGRVHLLGDSDVLARLAWAQDRKVSVVDCRSPIFSVREQLQLPRRIPGDCTLFWSPQFNIPLLYRGKLLVTIHDALHLAMPHFMAGVHRRLYARALLGAVRQKADALICNSRFTADELIRLVGISAAKIEVIHLGVDEAWFGVDASARPLGKPYFVFVGNVKAHKNIAGLVKAFRLVCEKLPHDLVIVGKKEGFVTGDRRVESWAAALGERVKFTGVVDDALLKRWVACAALRRVRPAAARGHGLRLPGHRVSTRVAARSLRRRGPIL
jgi:glycosyltransferase involved in cell wall biosynthesis